ncbi:hypothetical protein FACS1894101_1940 [Betaproteobacteria bacterium]|nr:hypothetical protein FACS1894101_1940 [Betaproteobacteria bacterium]
MKVLPQQAQRLGVIGVSMLIRMGRTMRMTSGEIRYYAKMDALPMRLTPG